MDKNESGFVLTDDIIYILSEIVWIFRKADTAGNVRKYGHEKTSNAVKYSFSFFPTKDDEGCQLSSLQCRIVFFFTKKPHQSPLFFAS